jgi:hypothetical protein
MVGMQAEKKWHRIDAELEYARKVRAEGNEGMARVCARRAAGWAIGVYQKEHLGIENIHHSAYYLLNWFQLQEHIKPEDREAAIRLTTQITESHELPHPEDPILDAQQIINSLKSEVDRKGSRSHQS